MENEQELIYKFSLFEKQINEIQQQIELVEKGIIDLQSLNFGLDDLVNGKDKEIFASVGKGIFVKAKIISEELKVDIGNGIFVKKNIFDTKKLIEEQTKKLIDVKEDLEKQLLKLDKEITTIMNSGMEKNSLKEEDCSCENGKKCNCHEGKCDCNDCSDEVSDCEDCNCKK